MGVRILLLLDDFSHLTSTYGTATFADGEAETFLHCDFSEEGNFEGYVITRHYHFHVFRKLHVTSYVRSTEVELRAVAVEEWRVTATFVLRENVYLTLELSVWLYGTRLTDNHTALDCGLFDTTEKHTGVITSFTTFEDLTEHLYTSDGRSQLSAWLLHTDDLNGVTSIDNTTLDTACSNSTTASDREYILNRHEERKVNQTLWLRDFCINCSHEFEDLLFAVSVTFEALKSRTDDDAGVVAVVLVRRKKFTNFHFYKLEHFFVINKVSLVHEYYDVRNTYLTSKEDVLTGLWHRAISCSYNKDSTVHLGSTSYHVLYVVSVAGAVNVCVVTVLGFVLNVSSVDRDTTLFFFRSGVDGRVILHFAAIGLSEYSSDRSGQRSLTVVNVTDGADVNVRLCSLECFLSHYW